MTARAAAEFAIRNLSDHLCFQLGDHRDEYRNGFLDALLFERGIVQPTRLELTEALESLRRFRDTQDLSAPKGAPGKLSIVGTVRSTPPLERGGARPPQQPMAFLDHLGEFNRATHACKSCGWTGPGAATTSGETFGDGVDKHCPQCGDRYRFVKWSVFVPPNQF